MRRPETVAHGLASSPDGGQTTLAASSEGPAAFDCRCIPSDGVTPRSKTAGIFPRRALSAGRRARLGATRDFHHGLRGSTRTTVPTLRGWRWLSGAISLLLGVCACGGPMEDERQGLDASALVVSAEALDNGSVEPASAVETVTGGRTKVVWIQDLGDGTDVLGLGRQLVLMGFDTDDDRGERRILDLPGSYAKPLITPSGDRIIYGDRLEGTVMVVDWTGQNLRHLAGGVPLAVWANPDDATEWVYIGSDPDEADPDDSGRSEAAGAIKITTATVTYFPTGFDPEDPLATSDSFIFEVEDPDGQTSSAMVDINLVDPTAAPSEDEVDAFDFLSVNPDPALNQLDAIGTAVPRVGADI